MGGTFDPIHHGHLSAANAVRHRYELDEVVSVPTGQPWPQTDRRVTPAENRYLLPGTATAGNPPFPVHRSDVDTPRPT